MKRLARNIIQEQRAGKGPSFGIVSNALALKQNVQDNLLGYAEFKLGHPEPALQRLQKALALDPNNEDYLLDLGEFLGYHRSPKNAVELFEVASRRMSLR